MIKASLLERNVDAIMARYIQNANFEEETDASAKTKTSPSSNKKTTNPRGLR